MSTLPLTRDEMNRYARTVMLPAVGADGQRRLKAASVLIVGLGGLGSAAALYLAAAGVGRIGIADPDRVDLSNLQRQVIHDNQQLGRRKVDSARDFMLRLNPHLCVDVYGDAVTDGNVSAISEGYEIVVDGTDNFGTRYRINDHCVRQGKAFVYGAVYQFEGQVSVFDARRGPCYRCLFPEPEAAGAADGPQETGLFNVLPGTVGTIQASEVLKRILGIGEPLVGRLLLYDALRMQFHQVLLSKNPACSCCGAEAPDPPR